MSEDQPKRETAGDGGSDQPNAADLSMPGSPREHSYEEYFPAYQPSMYPESRRNNPEIDYQIRPPDYDTPPYSYSAHHYHSYSPPYTSLYPHPPDPRTVHSEPNRSLRNHSSETHLGYQDYFQHRHPQTWGYPSYQYDPHYDRPFLSATSAFAAASHPTGHFPGTTPPRTGDEELPVVYSGPIKSDDCTALNPYEGYETPPTESLNDNSKPTGSVPDNIYLQSDSAYTSSPDMPDHGSPISTLNNTYPSEPVPELPTFHRAETNKSDVANSSSNSSSHEASNSSGSDLGWMRHYNSLVEYKKREGHCDVPQKYQAGDINLGIWVNKQRMERRKRNKGKKSSMSPSRERRLNDIKFNWGKEKGQASWDEKYRELCAFKELHGHCRVKTKDKEYKTLGRWVTSQRSDYKNDRMDQEKIDLLNAVGFVWDCFPGN